MRFLVPLWALLPVLLLAAAPAQALKPRCTEEPTASYMKHKVFKAKIAKDYGITQIDEFVTKRKCFIVTTVVDGQPKTLFFNPVTGEPVDLPPDRPKKPKKEPAAKKKPVTEAAG